jgi:hypothetical protein
MSGRTICMLGALAFGVTVHGAARAQVPVLREPANEPGPREPAAAAPPSAPAVTPLPPPPAAPAGLAAPPVTTPAVPQPSPASVTVPPGYKLVPISEARHVVPYEDGDPIPAGYHLRRQARRGPVIAGSIVMGVPWMFSVTGAAADDFEHKSGLLLVPGIGPWLMLLAGGAKDTDCAPNGDACSTGKAGLRSILVLDGLVQSTGAVLLTLGLLYPRQVLVPNPLNVSLIPARVGEHGYGLGAVGTF